jgi:hypothetical protein
MVNPYEALASSPRRAGFVRRLPLLAGLIVGCAATALAACARNSASHPALVSPVAFPLYRDSDVLSVRAWHHTLSQSERDAFGMGSNGGSFSGYEVLSATPDSFDDLVTWLQALSMRPPDGYRVTVWGTGIEDARASARNLGFDFGIFDRKERGVWDDVVVVAVDPDAMQRRAGIMLSVLGRFHQLPAFLRGAMNAQVKAQTGFTVSEALDPATPIGAAIDSLQRLHEIHARGVIFIDARPAGRT